MYRKPKYGLEVIVWNDPVITPSCLIIIFRIQNLAIYCRPILHVWTKPYTPHGWLLCPIMFYPYHAYSRNHPMIVGSCWFHTPQFLHQTQACFFYAVFARRSCHWLLHQMCPGNGMMARMIAILNCTIWKSSNGKLMFHCQVRFLL